MIASSFSPARVLTQNSTLSLVNTQRPRTTRHHIIPSHGPTRGRPVCANRKACTGRRYQAAYHCWKVSMSFHNNCTQSLRSCNTLSHVFSDSTAAVVTNALFFLARSPQKLRKLQQFLDQEFPNGPKDWSFDKARRIPYLNHVINETMRLKAPIPLGLPRLTPPEGLAIDGTYIPGNVIVSVPTHTIHLDPRYFEDPLEFLPERWESIVSADDVPFLPFSRGM